MKIAAKLLALCLGMAVAAGCGDKKDEGDKGSDKAAVGQKIKLDFHIMSKCPFGVKVMQAITPVLEKMGDNIEFNAEYIGREKDGELTSMHGEPEVQGNILQLCAKENGDFTQWLNFLKCQNEDWRKIPEGWEKCADTAKIDKAKMKACYEGDKGKELLKASFKKSQDAKATGSPTIFMNGEPYRGGRSESSFGRAICAAFEGAKPKYCDDIPAPIKVPVTVVNDKRCTDRGCDSQRFLSFITHTMEGAEVKELDYSDPEGKALFEKTGEKYLPVAIFGKDVEKEENGYKRLKRRLKPIEGTEELVYPLGRTWDPTAEVCDDGVDNTGDGMVDCADETCKSKKVCREEIANKVNLFVMSQCPYGVRTVDAMEEVLKNFGKDRKKMDFQIEFIGKDVDGKLTSMHGDGEVNENLRQICAQKHYAKDYKFMDYVLCRNKAYTENRGKEEEKAWEACAKDGVSAAVIKKCAEGEEGKELLKASYKLAEDLEITGSPNWLLNNKFEMRGRAPEGIKAAFCEKNQGVAGCENTLSAGEPGSPAPAGSCGGGPTPPEGGRPPIEMKKIDAPAAPAAAPEAKPE